MKTPATSELPEITWERSEKVDNHDGYIEYNAFGESSDGRNWMARWFEYAGEFQNLEDIEEA